MFADVAFLAFFIVYIFLLFVLLSFNLFSVVFELNNTFVLFTLTVFDIKH